ncbi:MAG: hypothetical protein ACRDTP_07555 [Mycobacteriales bacterium]
MASASANHRRKPVAAARRLDALLATAAGLLVLAVHDVGYLLKVPYWLDESWVVAFTRMPLSSLRHAIGPSPAIWTLLVRLQVFGGFQRQRVVPLVFAGLAVAAGYALFRVLGHGRPVALVFGAGTVLLAPAMLARDDLKQYTADAFVLVLLLVLVARLDASWTRGRVLTLGVVVGLAPGLSSAALFGGTAAMAAVVVAVLVAQRWDRLRSLAAAIAIAVVGDVFWLLVFLLPNTNQALIDYWRPEYPPRSVSGVYDYLSSRAPVARAGVGVDSLWVVAALLLLGVVVLLARRRVATALTVPLAAAGVLVAGLLHLSPVLDARTSTWLFVGVDLVMAVGIAGLAREVARRRRVVGAALALVLLAVPAVLFAAAAWPGLRSTTLIPDEDVRGPEQYVAAHRGPDDVVVVDFGASYAWAYYAQLDVVPVPSSTSGTGFDVKFPPSSRVIMVPQAGSAAVGVTLRRAESLTGGRPGARIWVVRSHMHPDEARRWAAAVQVHRLRTVDGGWPVPLLVEPAG